MYGEGVRRDIRAVGGARRLPYRMLVSARGDPNFQGHIAILLNSSIFRSHCGSRAFSVQVNILAVSARVSQFLVGFLFLVSTHFCPGLMSQSRVVDDASGKWFSNRLMQLTSSNFGSRNGSGSDLHGMGNRSGSTTDEELDALFSKFLHFETQFAQIPTLTNLMSRMEFYIFREHLQSLQLDLQRWNRISSPSPRVCARSRHMQPQHQMYLVRQDPGLHSNKLMAPQPKGPMGPGSSDDNRNTRRRLDTSSSPEDEHARSAVLLQFSCDKYHAGVSTSINSIWEKSNIPAQPTTNSSGFIAKQVACPPDSYSRRKFNVRTLWLDTRMTASPRN